MVGEGDRIERFRSGCCERVEEFFRPANAGERDIPARRQIRHGLDAGGQDRSIEGGDGRGWFGIANQDDRIGARKAGFYRLAKRAFRDDMTIAKASGAVDDDE